MRKLFATILLIGILLGMTACNRPDRLTTVYVVVGQKNYVKGELSSSASFRYDDHGRPVMVEVLMADGSGEKVELQYDQYGNRAKQIITLKRANVAEGHGVPTDWNLTYADGLLTHAEMIYDGEDTPQYIIDFYYDGHQRLVLAEYGYPNGGGYTRWLSYAYDKDGRLIHETRCAPNGSKFSYSRFCYIYDAKGRLIEQYGAFANTKEVLPTEEADALEFTVKDVEHFFFYYDQEGKLAYVGDGADDTYSGGSAAIYSDERYTFDDNGNLLRVQQGEDSWVEFTYEAMEMRQSDAAMHRRLCHGIDGFIPPYLTYAIMDPVFWELCPKLLYGHHLWLEPFYYLVPYPQTEILQ